MEDSLRALIWDYALPTIIVTASERLYHTTGNYWLSEHVLATALAPPLTTLDTKSPFLGDILQRSFTNRP